MNYCNISIILLIIIYVLINIFYKKYLNILVFLAIFLLVKTYLVENLINALLISYVLSVVYGIIKNFHLLENFQEKEFDISNDNNLIIPKPENIKVNPVRNLNYKKKNKIKNTKKRDLNLSNFDISESDLSNILKSNILDKFLEKLKLKKIIFVKKKVDINTIEPIISKLNVEKINKFRNLSNDKKNILNNSEILVSKDNFIIDGHHRWFTKKSLINQNTTYNLSIDENITVKMVNLNIKPFINELIKFKNNYNKQILNSQLDKTKIDKAKLCLDNIKKNLSELDNYYNQLNNLKLL